MTFNTPRLVLASALVMSMFALRQHDRGRRSDQGPDSQLQVATQRTLQRDLRMDVPVVYPSPAYYNPYLRDSFWAAQTLGDRRFAVSVLHYFTAALNAAGEPPTLFVNAYRHPIYHHDESAAIVLIWAWRNQMLYNSTPPHAALGRVLSYLVAHAHDGSFVTPAGSYTSWWDAHVMPRPGTLAYNQGLFAVALRCAKLLGLAVPGHAIDDADSAYRALYDPRLGYLKLSTVIPASDASALTGEFLSLWMFGHPILSDAEVQNTLRHLTPFESGFRVVALPPASGRTGRFLPDGKSGVAGDYQNGASWLLYDAISFGAAGLHGLPNALDLLRARLSLEFRHGVVLHEFLQTKPGLPYYGSEPPIRDNFVWDTFTLVVDRVLENARKYRPTRSNG